MKPERPQTARLKNGFKETSAAIDSSAGAVVVYDKTQVTGAYVTGPWWGRSVEVVQGRVVIAVAIKYL